MNFSGTNLFTYRCSIIKLCMTGTLPVKRDSDLFWKIQLNYFSSSWMLLGIRRD